MNSLWSILALALMGADDLKSPVQPPTSSPFTIEITIGSSEAQPQECPKVVADSSPKSSPSPYLPVSLPKTTHPRTTHDAEAQESWPMTLPEAIRIGLDNSESVRVISFGAQGIPIGGFTPTPLNQDVTPAGLPPGRAPIVIARLNADASTWRFQAEVMAQLRSIEQQYWNLAQAHVQLWSADRAVSLAEEVLRREQAELVVGRGTVADVAETAQRLEQFNLDLVTRTSDVITTERQLRNILGLPPADNRRIIPVTPPVEARLTPDWDSSLAEMLNCQPEIAQHKVLVRLAELQLLIARNQLLPPLSLDTLYQFNGLGQQVESAEAVMTGITLKALNPIFANMTESARLDSDPVDFSNFLTRQAGYAFQAPLACGRSPLLNTRQSKYALRRSRASLQQVVHQTTHSLARFFLEVDANYKQFQTASRLRAAAADRLDAQRAYYEEGRITIDRFLDAVSQYATAVATEAQYKTSYNISIVALEEAKGTLLAYDNIVVAEPNRQPTTGQPAKSKPDSQAKTVTLPPMPAPEPAPAEAKTDYQTNTASAQFPQNPFEIANSTILPPPSMPVPPIPPVPTSVAPKTKEAEADVKAKPKTWTFSISIGGAQPIVIMGTISAGDPAPAAAHGK
jgi:outer membrane protein TolC